MAEHSNQPNGRGGAQEADTPMTLAVAARDRLEARAAAWASLPDDDLRREAMRAVAERNHNRLWSICEAYLTTKTSKRSRLSRHTLRAYRRGVLDVLEAWRGENLLRPRRNAADLYVLGLTLKDRAGNVIADAKGAPVPLAPGSVAVKLAAARLLFKALAWADATSKDPFEDVRAPEDTTPAWEKRRPYEAEEVSKLLARAKPKDRALVLLGAHAGMRISEMIALEWRDVDLDAGTLYVRHGKGGKPGTVFMSAALIEALHALPRDAATVLGFGDTRARRRLRRLAFRACVKYRGVHALRHTCGTRLARERGLEAAQHHLRHQNIATTQVYAKWNQDDLRQAVRGWA